MKRRRSSVGVKVYQTPIGARRAQLPVRITSIDPSLGPSARTVALGFALLPTLIFGRGPPGNRSGNLSAVRAS